MPLSDHLQSTVAAVQAAVPTPTFAAIAQSITDLEASGIVARAPQVGTRLPLTTLPDLDGTPVDLAQRLRAGPLVVLFYSGGWCPSCNLTLRAFADVLPQIAAAGAGLVAITPERGHHARQTAQDTGIGFPVLVDTGNDYARDLGLVFALPDALRPLYRGIGIDLTDRNGCDVHELPLAATFVLDRSGTVRWPHVAADFTTRAEPADVVAALSHLD